ncbi:MAG: porin [Burkholderiales bacterium]
MKKSLIALAVTGAFVAPAAMADSGNVVIYGKIHASYDITDNGNGGATGVNGTRTNKISDNQSRIGFKGSEDLGNGLSAIWQVENKINVDGVAGAWNSRNTFLGLSGKSWGTVLLGKLDTPYKSSTRDLDNFGDTLADNRSIMGGGDKAQANFDGRPNNVLAYVSPKFNGFDAAIAYVAGAETATTSGQKKGNAWSLDGKYENGPLFAALAYERHNLGDAGTGTLGAGTPDKSEKAWKLGIGYKMDAFKVGFVYEKTSDDNSPTGTEKFGHNAYTLNGGYTFGSNEAKIAYTRAGDVASNSDSGAKQWSLGLDHNLSKRTKVYALYTNLNNDTNGSWALGSTYSAGGGLAANGTNATQSAFSLGMMHSF